MLSKSLSVAISSLHSLNKALTVYEGQKSDSHPLETLPVNVDMKVGRVKVNDFRVWLAQQVTVANW
jgi:flagellar motor switch/type III secretory pathway protein FliN